jgi:OPA family glycerol-3-phosphate transporter-like MFS transporter
MSMSLSRELFDQGGRSLDKARTARWQRITLATLFVGYAGYYVCRSNLSVATPLLLEEHSGRITKEDIGTVASVGVLLYAIGKVTNGVLADFLGGRVLFLLGMAGSVVCTVLFGLSVGLAAFTLAWAVNRYVQSGGWGALVKIASRWYPVSVHATVMGLLAGSYLLGDALARAYLGALIEWGVGWRGIFFLAGGTLGAITVVSWFTLKGSPREIGGLEPAANPGNVFGSGGDSPRPESLARLLIPLTSNLFFWLACVLSVGLTFIRETFTFWTPTYLKEVGGLSKGWAAIGSTLFPLVGAASALLGGTLSDRFKGRRGRVVLPSLVLLVVALVLLSLTSTDGRPVTALLLISAVSFFMTAPYSFCSGVIPLDLGGKRGSSTAAGLIDAAGYLGATLSGFGIGSLAQRHGWPIAFIALAVTAGLTAVAGGLYWALQEFGFRRRSRFIPSAEAEWTEKAPMPGTTSSATVPDQILILFRERGTAAYVGEAVSQTEHALQTAWASEKAGSGSALIAAALLHDVGHLLHHLPADCAQAGIDDRHENLGARWVERHFGPDVSEPIRLHVAAKRYLCVTEPGYLNRLSEASLLSLKLQGGPFSPEEVGQFEQDPHAAAAVALRRWDEQAKIPGLKTPDLEHFRPYLEGALVRRD